jgi:hypothetical protein
MARKRKQVKQLAESLREAIDRAHNLLEDDFHSAGKLVASAHRQGDKFVFENGWVIKTKNEPWLGKKKNFYDVYNSNTGTTEAENLGLFMSAMAVVRVNSSRRKSRITDTQNILRSDNTYQHHLNDAAIFGIRLKSSHADEFKRDFYLIRMEEAMINCKAAKTALRSYI